MVEILHSIKAFDVPRLVAFHCEHCLLLLQTKEGETNIDKHIYEQTVGEKKHCLKQSLNSIRTKEMNTWSQ